MGTSRNRAVRTEGVRRLGLGRRAAVVLLATATVAVGLASCTPPKPLMPQLAKNMTDEELRAKILQEVPEMQEAMVDPSFRADIPPDLLSQVEAFIANLSTKAGRNEWVGQIREFLVSAKTFVPDETFLGDRNGLAVVSDGFDPAPPGPTGTRSPGVAPPVEANSDPQPIPTTPCKAPNGPGDLARPPGEVTAGQILSPQHDNFALSSQAAGQPAGGPITHAGQNQNFGLRMYTLPTGAQQQQLKVVVNLDDIKGLGPAALRPLLSIRPIGGDTADEDNVNHAVVDKKVHCYKNDPLADKRGYWEGWIPFPQVEPGFQVMAEVVENDWYFQNVANNLPLLSVGGPQYWAGADRATVHIGASPVTRMSELAHSIGAFATSTPDSDPSRPNVLTETNGNATDDLEAAISRIVRNKVLSAASDKVDTFLKGWYPLGIQMTGIERLEPTIDLQFATSAEGFVQADEPPGNTGALLGRVEAHGVRAKIKSWFLGVPCDAHIDVDLEAEAYVWADGSIEHVADPRIDLDLELGNEDFSGDDWANPLCWPVYAAAQTFTFAGGTEYFAESAIGDGITEAFDRGGALDKLLDGFDPNDLMPTVDIAPSDAIGGLKITPHVGRIENAWCGSYWSPKATTNCRPRQDLIGHRGVEVASNATMIGGGPADKVGFSLSGRFGNVYRPSLSTTVEDVVTSHRDRFGEYAAAGVVIDPTLINLALRHAAQGPTADAQTNGLFDVKALAVPSTSLKISTTPMVAPIVTGLSQSRFNPCGDGQCGYDQPWPESSDSVPILLPDTRLSLDLGPNTGPPILFTMAARTNASVRFDGPTGKLQPNIEDPRIDLQVLGNCKVDYSSAYYLAYAQCGRGGAWGTGSQFSLPALLDYLVNEHVLKGLKLTLGEFKLPDFDNLVPGLHAALDAVRSNNRGGLVAIYADLRPLPKLEIAVSKFDSPTTKLQMMRGAQTLNIDFNVPDTQVTFEVVDVGSGATVPTSPHPFAPFAATVPLDQFTETSDNFGYGVKIAQVTMTVVQPGLNISASTEYRWRPQIIDPCNPLIHVTVPGRVLPNIAIGGGGGGGGSTPCPT